MAATTLTIGGTPTAFYPLSTPWPLQSSGCDIHTYRPDASQTTMYAWDPELGKKWDPAKVACLPPAVTSWWHQDRSALVQTALGPTFACPQAYTSVPDWTLERAGMVQTLCCPSGFGFRKKQEDAETLDPLPTQCLSRATVGQTITYNQITVTGGASTLNHFFAATSVVTSQDIDISGIPINGWNLASTASGSSTGGDSTATATAIATETSSVAAETSSVAAETSSTAADDGKSSGTPIGVTVGVAVGVGAVVGLVAVFVAIFLIRRRRRRGSNTVVNEVGSAPVVNEVDGAPQYKPIGFNGHQVELPEETVNRPSELYSDNPNTRNTAYELADSRERRY